MSRKKRKKKKVTIEIEEDHSRFTTPRKVGGSGVHRDKRKRRDRSRNDQKTNLKKRYEEDN